MFLDSLFTTEKTYTAHVENLQQTVALGVPGVKEWVPVACAKCIYWIGSMADSFISSQHRASISAVALVKPTDIDKTAIQQNARVTVKDGNSVLGVFSLVALDDIGGQNEVVVFQLTEYKTK